MFCYYEPLRSGGYLLPEQNVADRDVLFVSGGFPSLGPLTRVSLIQVMGLCVVVESIPSPYSLMISQSPS